MDAKKTFADFQLRTPTEEIIESNYNYMIKQFEVTSLLNTPEYAAKEEACLVALAMRELEAERKLRVRQTNQVYKGEGYSITTRGVGGAVEIAWLFDEPLPADATLRGYKREGGFCENIFPLDSNGVCIAESKFNGATVQSLAEGVDHYFTFVVMHDRGKNLSVSQTLRFSVRVPTQAELSRVDEFFRTVATMQYRINTETALSKKTSDALQELKSFVEFDENVTSLEKEMINRISGKDYTEEEKEEKIQRLRDVVESLRVQHS